MSAEAETIIAFVFKRSGKKEISFSTFYLTLSMDLNWFTPSEAKKFIQNAIEKKLLIKKKDLLTPAFNIEKKEIPLGFTPSKKIDSEEKIEKKEEKEDILTKIIKEISKNTNTPSEEIIRKIKNIEKEKNITPELAALILGKENNIEYSDFLSEIEEKIFKN